LAARRPGCAGPGGDVQSSAPGGNALGAHARAHTRRRAAPPQPPPMAEAAAAAAARVESLGACVVRGVVGGARQASGRTEDLI
jgi:hypothetical protein